MNSNGPWGRPPNSQKPSSGDNNKRNGQASGDDVINKLLKSLNDFFDQKDGSGGNGGGFNNGGGPSINFGKVNKKLLSFLLLVLFLGWLATGFYTVNTKQEALILRFGKYVGTKQPGLNYHLPFPIEKKILVTVTDRYKDEIGYITGRDNADFSKEILVLTGDENIVNINFEVQWQISNAKDFMFNLQDPRLTVREAAESAMREIIGTTPISDILSGGRTAVQLQITQLLQEILDSYQAGIKIAEINLKGVPPATVDSAFKDVQAAKINQEETINKAIAYENEITHKAKGEAAKIVQIAEAYKGEKIAEAEGQTDRFLQVLKQYKLASEVTKERIYIETIENILQNNEKIIIDNNSSGVLPYLSLNEMKKSNR
ncbi:MAG: FtsH protease activity modulator HflK [Pseudomonadota bacterium]